jgi:putative ABC transport system permease protein
MIADENFASVYNIPVKEGSFFGRKNYIPGQLVFNESAVKGLGWENATGKFAGRLIGRQFTVAGVIKDFHIASLHENMQPLAFLHIRDMKAYEYLSVKLNPGPVHTTITAIENKWKEWFPDTPFEYFFMDDKFQSLYKADIQLQKASGIASALTFIIVLLGIAGVVSFTVMKRSKEIAVRKVLGAGRWNIILIFLKEYTGLILLANLIGWPMAYLASGKLLENYAYRIPQTIFPFLWVGAFILVAVFCAVIIQCFKAASMNPIVRLRSE